MPAGVRLAPQNAEARTGSIDEHAICLPCIFLADFPRIHEHRLDHADTQPVRILLNARQLVLVDIARHDATAILHELCEMRCFAARRRAAVDDEFSRLRCHHMSDEHRTLVLHLATPILQRCQSIEGTMLLHDEALRCPRRRNAFYARFPQGNCQFLRGIFQRVGAQAKRRFRVVEMAELFRRVKAQCPDPMLHQPLRMTAREREMLRRMAFARGEGRFLRLTHGRAQHRIDKT